jgi:hypothetical protein
LERRRLLVFFRCCIFLNPQLSLKIGTQCVYVACHLKPYMAL